MTSKLMFNEVNLHWIFKSVRSLLIYKIKSVIDFLSSLVKEFFVCAGEGVNEFLFLRMKIGDNRTSKLSPATVEMLPFLQDDLRN